MKDKIIRYCFAVALTVMCSAAVMAQSLSQSGGERARRYRLREVKVTGVSLIEPHILSSSAGLNVGDSITIPSPFVSAAIERLWSQRRYSDVKLSAIFHDRDTKDAGSLDGGDVTIVLAMREQPRVFNWDFEGIKDGKISELRDKLKLRRNSELSEYVIDKNVKVIKEFYAEKGFRNADVSTRIDNDSLNDNMVNVTFVIDPKKRVKIEEIVFEGSENFEQKRLRKTFKKTHQRSWNIFRGRKFKESEYANDKLELIDFYNSKGYRNATIISDSIYYVEDNRLGIKLTVSEGNKYFIRNIEWIGNSKYETEQLQQMFAVSTGDTYDKKSMHKRLGVGRDANPEEMSVLSLYQNEGYLMSQIDPAEVIVGRDSIDLEIKIFEGRPFTINDVKISGNMRVDDEVIRRDIYTRPGELYNRSLLMQTMRTLSTMGHFNAEAIMPDIQPVSNELVDIGWVLEEQASDQFNISGGWGSGSFVGSVGVTLNNLSARNFFKKGAWRPYPMGQNQKLSLQAQTNGTYYKAFSLSFTDPWVGGKKPNSLTVTSHYSDQNNAYYAWSESTEYFRTVGVSVGLGKRLTWPDPYFSLYMSVGYERYMLKDWSSFIMENGDANLISATFSFSRSSVDQAIYPRTGSLFSITTQLTPPYSLWDKKDYSDSSMSDEERYKMIEFHKWQLKTQWYENFLSNSKLVLMLGAEMGYLGHYDKFKESPFERFEVGGDGMSGYSYYGIDMVSLRGYDDGALDPIGSDYSMAYNKYTMELRYPVVLQPQSQIYFLTFLEAGNGFRSWRDFSPFDVKRSAGVGVRLYLPVVGLLGLDWGYGFDRASGMSEKSGSHMHFIIGQQF